MVMKIVVAMVGMYIVVRIVVLVCRIIKGKKE